MKKFILCLVLLLMAGLVWWGISTDETFSAKAQPRTAPSAKSFNKKLDVVVSGYAVYSLAREIGGDKIQLTMLVAPGTEPHDFDPTPGSIIAVDKSDLFLYVSNEIDPWVGDILRGLETVRSQAVGRVEKGENPHLWMTPQGATKMAQQIAQALTQADPKNAAYYAQRAETFEQSMQQLDQDFKAGLSTCSSRYVLHIGHTAFAPLAQAYGLELEVLSGSARQGEHSVYKLAELVQQIRQKKVSAIFTEEMLSQQLAQTLAGETSVAVLPLYTVEEVSKQDFDEGISYEIYMRLNLQHLQEGLVCLP